MKNINFRKVGITFFWLALLSTTTVFVVSAVQRKRNTDLDKVEITLVDSKDMQHMLTKAEIKKVLNDKYKQNLTGISLTAIKPEQIETVLQAIPYVKTAEVFIDATQKLNIRIKERMPILRVIGNDGSSYYLDEDARRMPLVANFSPRIMVATGEIKTASTKNDSSLDAMKDLIGLAQDLKKDPFMDALVDQIYVDSIGDYILIPKLGSQRIVLGNRTDVEKKFKKLSLFYKEGLSREGWQKYRTINLKYRDQVVCQLNEAPKA